MHLNVLCRGDMMELKIILGILDKIMVLPLAIITFLILIYIGIYLLTKDPDVIRSRIFLKYNEIRKAILLLIAFAFVLILHMTLIFYPDVSYYISDGSSSFIYNLQRVLGLILIFILITFVFLIYRSVKDNSLT